LWKGAREGEKEQTKNNAADLIFFFRLPTVAKCSRWAGKYRISDTGGHSQTRKAVEMETGELEVFLCSCGLNESGAVIKEEKQRKTKRRTCSCDSLQEEELLGCPSKLYLLLFSRFIRKIGSYE
jgi:hypothetical protein